MTFPTPSHDREREVTQASHESHCGNARSTTHIALGSKPGCPTFYCATHAAQRIPSSHALSLCFLRFSHSKHLETSQAAVPSTAGKDAASATYFAPADNSNVADAKTNSLCLLQRTVVQRSDEAMKHPKHWTPDKQVCVYPANTSVRDGKQNPRRTGFQQDECISDYS